MSLKKAEKRLADARAALSKEVEKAFPVGCRVKSRMGRGFMRGVVTGWNHGFQSFSTSDVCFELDSNGSTARKDYRGVERE